MKRLLGIALIASLLAAPAVMGQTQTPAKPKTAPTGAPAAANPGGTTQDTPQNTQPPAAGPSATTGGKDNPTGKVHGAPEAKQPAGDAAAAAAQKAWEEAAKAGPNHKLLEWFAGDWQAEVKDLTPGQESTDKGEMHSEMVYGGRFLSMDYKGRSHGKFFTGGGTMGYSNTDKRFESTWADSMSTTISFMSGTMSADNKVLTLQGEMTDPATGKKSTQKEVTTITGKDSYKSEFYMGSTKVMEISYVRGKGAAKKDEPKAEQPKGK